MLELGPGTGTGVATREMLCRGHLRLTAVDADRRMAAHDCESLGPARGRCRPVVSPFEDASLTEGIFHLVVVANSFHGSDQARALDRVAGLL